ncbi:MAG: endonuclease III [Candidatus Eisenbacteria bacterium]|uniref:Endonuclease III n=1 Tax=Eiseniibacteriota bacterium TaxID=2212470 RepID=A0A956M161_UNCEI|nr:endonuclease III [Candidatus Eisenbacteria bacterium]
MAGHESRTKTGTGSSARSRSRGPGTADEPVRESRGTTRSTPPTRRAGRPSTRLPRRAGADPIDVEAKARARKILRALYRTHPDAHCALDFQTPLELYVATVLSAQCTDERVNKTTPALFARCRRPEDYLSLGSERLEELIRSTGFFRNKARSILGGCQVIAEEFGGELPRTLEELVRIPGCGRKTANVILGNAFDTPGITVDTHVQRLSKRLDLSEETDPVKIESDLQELFPEKDWTQLSHSLIWHGRQICDARKPLCDRCSLRKLCRYPERMASSPALPKATKAAGGTRPKAAKARPRPQKAAAAPPAKKRGSKRV